MFEKLKYFSTIFFGTFIIAVGVYFFMNPDLGTGSRTKEKRRQQDGDKDDLCPEGLIHEEECQDDADDV